MKRFNNEKVYSKMAINLMSGGDECRLITGDGANIATFRFEGHCQSAAYAINSHNALVEANNVMTTALQALTDESIDISDRVAGVAMDALICRDDILANMKGES